MYIQKYAYVLDGVSMLMLNFSVSNWTMQKLHMNTTKLMVFLNVQVADINITDSASNG